MSVFISNSDLDHPEAKEGSSGIYINTCLSCSERFMGYKNRRYCAKHVDKKWHEMSLSPPKGESKPLTQVDYHKYLAMRDELIFEQKAKIESQLMTINKLRNKLNANHNN